MLSSKAIEEAGAGAGAAPPRRLKVLFFLPGIARFEPLESLLAGMLAAGHQVLVAADADRVAKLREKHRGLDLRKLPRPAGVWRIAASAIRRSLDYLRCLEPEHADAGPRRQEARDHAPRALRMLLLLPPFRWGVGRRALAWLLRRVEAALPLPRQVKAYISEQTPDVVLVAPVAGFGSAHADYLRAAEAARIPSLLVGASDDEGVSADTLEDVERAARSEVAGRLPGRFLRPLLWLLTPLVAIVLLVLRPRASGRAAIKAVRRSRKRARAREKALSRDAARQQKLARAEAKRHRTQGDPPKGGDQAPAETAGEREKARG